MIKYICKKCNINTETSTCPVCGERAEVESSTIYGDQTENFGFDRNSDTYFYSPYDLSVSISIFSVRKSLCSWQIPNAGWRITKEKCG